MSFPGFWGLNQVWGRWLFFTLSFYSWGNQPGEEEQLSLAPQLGGDVRPLTPCSVLSPSREGPRSWFHSLAATSPKAELKSRPLSFGSHRSGVSPYRDRERYALVRSLMAMLLQLQSPSPREYWLSPAAARAGRLLAFGSLFPAHCKRYLFQEMQRQRREAAS